MNYPGRGRPRCPACGSADVVRISYGYPTPEAIDEAERGEILLGGCCISDENPEWDCTNCEHEWGSADDD